MSHGHSSHGSGKETGGQSEAELSDPIQGSFRYAQEQAKNVLIATFKCCWSDEERLQVIGKTQEIVLKLIRTEVKYNANCGQIGVVMDELQSGDGLSDDNIINDVGKIEETVIKKASVLEKELATPDKLKEHPHYKNLLALIEKLEAERHMQRTPNVSIVAEVEEGPSSQPAEEIIPVTDPITKQSLNDPVRNKHCGHIYGKAAILELVRKNPHIRCPTIGCNNRNYIKKADLVYDPILASKINSKQRDMAKKKIQQQQQQQQQEEQRHHRSPRHRSPRHHHQSPK